MPGDWHPIHRVHPPIPAGTRRAHPLIVACQHPHVGEALLPRTHQGALAVGGRQFGAGDQRRSLLRREHIATDIIENNCIEIA